MYIDEKSENLHHLKNDKLSTFKRIYLSHKSSLRQIKFRTIYFAIKIINYISSNNWGKHSSDIKVPS